MAASAAISLWYSESLVNDRPGIALRLTLLLKAGILQNQQPEYRTCAKVGGEITSFR
jgi:hypothetical protein